MTEAIRKSRATLIELYTRLITVKEDKNKKVYWNGENNLYPNEIERIVNQSPTANRASKIMAKYVSGSGLTDPLQDVLVNEKKNYKVSSIAKLAGKDCAKQGGSWFHIGYGIEIVNDTEIKIVPKVLDVLDYTKNRKSIEDDEKQESKIWFKDYCETKTIFGTSKNKEKWFYPFNKDEAVVIAQIKADYKEKKGTETDDISVMLPHYRGQVYYWNTTPEYKYALAPIDSVYNSADTEARIQTWENGEVRTGFLGKTAVITQGLDEETSKNVDKDIADWLGETSHGIFRLDLENSEDITKVLYVQQLKAQIDPKIFSEMKKEIRSAILGAYNSIPEILVLSSSGALFGTSGETYREAKIFYNEQTEDERTQLGEVLTYLGFPCKIKPLIEVETENTPSI